MSRRNRNLKPLNGARLRFSAYVDKFGSKVDHRGNKSKTVLLTNVTRVDTGEVACGHVWFVVGREFPAIASGDTIEFDAKVSTYIKGHINRRKQVDTRTMDYGLAYPSNVVMI